MTKSIPSIASTRIGYVSDVRRRQNDNAHTFVTEIDVTIGEGSWTNISTPDTRTYSSIVTYLLKEDRKFI